MIVWNPNGEIVNAQIAADAAIARSKLATETPIITIPFAALKNNDGTPINATGGAGLFKIVDGGDGAGGKKLQGEAASGNVKVDTFAFEYVLPTEYVAATAFDVLFHAKESVGAATDSTTVVAVKVYRSGVDGTVGGDLAGEIATPDITTAWAGHGATVSGAGLEAGYKIEVYVAITTNDTGGTTGTVVEVGAPYLYDVNVKG